MFASLILAALGCIDSGEALVKYKQFIGKTAGAVFRLGNSADEAGSDTKLPDGYRSSTAYYGPVPRDNGHFTMAGVDVRGAWRALPDGFVGSSSSDRTDVARAELEILSGAFTALPSQDLGCFSFDGTTMSARRFASASGAVFKVGFRQDGRGIVDASIVFPRGIDNLVARKYDATPLGNVITSWSGNATAGNFNTATPADISIPTRPSQPTSPITSSTSIHLNAPIPGQNLPYILATVNGHEGKFIVDSGNDGVEVTRRFALAAGLHITGKSERVSMQAIHTDPTYRAEISIGKLRLSSDAVTGAPDSFGYDGIIGEPLFSLGRVEFDAEAEVIRLEPSKKPDVGVGDNDLDTSTGLPIVVLAVEGQLLHAVLDTGTSGTMVIPAGQFANASTRETAACMFQSYGIPQQNRQVDLRQTVHLGTVPLSMSYACLTTGRIPFSIVGLSALGTHRLTLDYRAGFASLDSR